MKKAKILVLVSFVSCFIALFAAAYYYMKQKEMTAELNKSKSDLKDSYKELQQNKAELNDSYKELERIKLELDSVTIKLNDLIKELTIYAPESLKNETLDLTKSLELQGWTQNMFSPIYSERDSSTKILAYYWTDEEIVIPYLLDYAKDRFGEESFNKYGLYNTILVLGQMDENLLEKYRDDLVAFIDRVEQLNREENEKNLLILKSKMNLS